MAEFDFQKEVADDIRRLKKERNAIILAHNYVLGEVQDIADFVGDSLELSMRARDVEEDVIVFCGVRFMAETAKVLSPDKTVILPANAGCPMADMADAAGVRALKAKHPGAITVAYVNTTAEVKTEVDICCTSGNAKQIIESLPKDREILFIPDQNLGANVAAETGREMILWDGFCPTHMRMDAKMIQRKREEFPDAQLIVHPECHPDIVALADAALSTGGMLKYVSESDTKQFIVGTELGIIHRLQKENPNKQFIPISVQTVCMNMKVINLEDVQRGLRDLTEDIQLSEEIIAASHRSIVRMLDRDFNF